ncbi:hypothetical protein PENTCL1PPCAC_2192, partial [Pristionchus entomophagus]
HHTRPSRKPSKGYYCIMAFPTTFVVIILFMVILALFAPENGECRMNVPQTIRKWGYPVETHNVITEDGYVLEMHRIPHGRNKGMSNTTCRPVILLQHGLEMDSSNWVDNPPEQAAAYVMADAGFDVWMGNVRGNRYGRKHIKLDSGTDAKFWKFSWQDMADRDLPALVNRALRESGVDSLHYVGHSQGSLIMFARLSEDERLKKQISSFHALAPAVYVANIKGLFRRFQFAIPMLRWWNSHSTIGELVPVSLFRLASASICAHTFSFGICSSILFNIAGPQSQYYNETRTPVYFSHVLSGTSARNVVHWTQMVIDRATRKFDFGSRRKNMAAYKSPNPPIYDFSKVTVPVHIYWGAKDWLVSDEDIESRLIPALNGTRIETRRKFADYNHFDFVWGTTASRDVYSPIINDVKQVEAAKLESTTCTIGLPVFPPSNEIIRVT